MRSRFIRIVAASILLLSFPAPAAECRASDAETSGRDNARWVNPMIGTGHCSVPTLWGDYGGTFPGAASPWGLLHLSPETSVRPTQVGYFYNDDSILCFSCIGHNSGYPNGSSGAVKLAFLPGSADSLPGTYSGRKFSHGNEHAEAGFYKVRFDDGDEVEMTAASHSGLLRYTAASDSCTVVLFNAGHIEIKEGRVLCGIGHVTMSFSRPLTGYELRRDTLFAHFKTDGPLQVAVTASMQDFGRSIENGRKQLEGRDFEALRSAVHDAWRRELACVDLHGAADKLNTIFYTALYHSMLEPANIADVDEKPRYILFSFWDTFRTLHPLLCLLKPDVQKAIVDSVLDMFGRYGRMPNGPMTGIHSIPVLLDSYVKGAVRCDVQTIYEACRGTYDAESSGKGMRQYIEQGFIDAHEDASVSRTGELAYDDWAMMTVCRLAGHEEEAAVHSERALNYANLWDEASMLMLPRIGDHLVRGAGELGFQESTRHTASLFAPHDNLHLVNLRGGPESYASRLDGEFGDGLITFDNETVLNYPHLFVWARRPDLAMKHVRGIVAGNYSDGPGGIPGNDDLGSMSSWLAFAVTGLMPACPGTDEYLALPPLAPEVVIHLPGGADLRITGGGACEDGAMPQPVLNGEPLQRCHVTHGELAGGGTLDFDGTKALDAMNMQLPYSFTGEVPSFEIRAAAKAPAKVKPDQECLLPVSVSNRGADGVCVTTLTCDGKAVASKNIRVAAGATVADTISYRLYAEGRHILSIGGTWKQRVRVVRADADAPVLKCCSIDLRPVARQGESERISFTLKNASGRVFSGKVPVLIDGEHCDEADVRITPGDSARYETRLPALDAGLHRVRIAGRETKVKIFKDAVDATVLDIDYSRQRAEDRSGFGNDGTAFGPLKWSDGGVTTATDAYVEFPKTESLMYGYDEFTILTWLLPRKSGAWHMDFFSKGDCTVLKMQSGRILAFFAGGWGRGECLTALPEGWFDRWHLVAGVCRKGEIRLYIDGEPVRTMAVKGNVGTSELPWNIGRNAEMPYNRCGENSYRGTRIYAAALDDACIRKIYCCESGSSADE